MRALWVAGAAVAALTVSGCDINTTPKQAKADCHCTATPPPTSTTATTTPPPQPDMSGSTDYAPEDHDTGGRGHGHGRHHGHGHGYAYNDSGYGYDGHFRRHGHGYHGGYEGHGGYYWRREYSELPVYTYDYHSTSTSSTYVGGSSGTYAETGGGYHVVPHGWVDGYGVMHTGGGAYAGVPAHYETGGRDRDRMSSWHGYDAYCPDDDR